MTRPRLGTCTLTWAAGPQCCRAEVDTGTTSLGPGCSGPSARSGSALGCPGSAHPLRSCPQRVLPYPPVRSSNTDSPRRPLAHRRTDALVVMTVAGVFSVPGSVLRALRARSHTISQQPIKKVLGWPFLPGEDSEAQGESATHPESPGVTRKKSDCKTDLSPSCSSASHRPKPGLSPPGVLANRLDGSAPSRSISQNKTFCF